MAIKLSTIQGLSVGDSDLFAVSYVPYLDSGELLTGTPTIVEITTTDLTITNKAVSTTTLTIEGVAVLTGQAVQFLVAGMLAGVTYTIKITVSTDSTPARTKVVDVVFKTAAA